MNTPKGAKDLMDEIRRERGKAVQASEKADAPHADAPDGPPNEPAPKRRRMRKASGSAAVIDELSRSPMFTVTIVGGLSIPDYPLRAGERLAVAKLTPISVAT